MRRWLVVLSLAATSLQAQTNIQYSVSNVLRWGNGQERLRAFEQRHEYFENLTDARITVSDFLLGFRLLHDGPPEFGLDSTGITKRFLEFRKEDLYLRAGTSFTLYGRGLSMNLFESRPLGFDNGLDGAKVEYKTRMVKVGFTAGDIRSLDILDLSRREDYRVRAGTIELNPYPFLSLGVDLVSGKTLPGGSLEAAQFDIPEYFGRLSVDDVDLYASYAEKRTTVYGDPGGVHRGTGFYGGLSFTRESFGISVEYKDYRFGIAGPIERLNVNRAKKAFAFQHPPIVHKEHTFTLLSRYPHVIDFNDEVGYQLDVFYTLLSQMTGNVNFSAASRHYAFDAVDTSSFFPLVYASSARKNSWLPSRQARYSPFWEFYTDFQYYFEEGGTDYALLGFNRRWEDATDEQVIKPTHIQWSAKSTRSVGVPISIQYTVGDDWVLKVTSERQWVYEDANTDNTTYFNHLVSLGVAKSPSWAVTLRYEFTSDFGTMDQRRDWTAIDASYKISNNHLVTFTAGGDRGGQVCANGVCRIVNPFLGIRASITSYL